MLSFECLLAEIICKIFKTLKEKDRRQLKLVSRLFKNCYSIFVRIQKRHPPKLDACWCNRYGGRLLHDCVCRSPDTDRFGRVLIGWEKY